VDALSLVAEISVGLAGFAAVAVMLGRGPGRWSEADAARIRLQLAAALGALFGSLLPIGLAWSGVGDALALRIGAAGIFAVILLWSIAGSRALVRTAPEEREVFNPRVAQIIRALSIATMLLLLVAAAGLAGRATAGLVFLALYLLLGYAAFGFARLIFVRPRAE
jgi:hypothetical protein